MDGNSVYLFIEISLVVLAVSACLLAVCFVFLFFNIVKENFEKKFEKIIKLAFLCFLTILMILIEVEGIKVIKYGMQFLAEVTWIIGG